MKRLTTSNFIERAKLKHGNLYIYDRSIYTTAKTKLIITCKVHGDFNQEAWSHLSGIGCPKCAGKNKTTEEFIFESKSIHNDTYDYSRTEYINSSKKVVIICQVHGEFEQNPNVHLRGDGCRLCGIEISKNKQRSSTAEFIKKSKLVHGDKYNYNEVKYINSSTKVNIICKDHGVFSVTPANHLRKRNCPICGNKQRGDKNRFKKEDFIKKAVKIHGDFYNYNKVEYVNSQTNILITCPKHGDFTTIPNTHLQGKKCKECHFENLSLLFRDDTNKFIDKAIKTHGKKYDYSLVDYIDSHYKVKIICKRHGVFEQNTVSHIKGIGCPYCTLTPQSKQELTITFELIKFFKDINPKGFKTKVNGKLKSIDIYIPQLKLGIEFDGSYWHKDKRALDKLKTEQLEDEGFEIFRVREEPLKKIFDDDIMSKQPFNGKQVTNDILKQIMNTYTLNAKNVRKIENYLDKKELQNEKGLDKYIDMILTEKAEKNN